MYYHKYLSKCIIFQTQLQYLLQIILNMYFPNYLNVIKRQKNPSIFVQKSE